ncbi:GNAT family N-acetyltransferase [Skermanella rosea]|uniref:GNAT family N-acetyltransferase n=1 Tax=Skermanella rosea TaxID=1817965 RepID=UPI0019313FB1|nr:GNAT family N-acetyltransferase [Skermanella rosea]UEM02895.1 GNAT family N-acetyltransferase [Skermanella rosea]
MTETLQRDGLTIVRGTPDDPDAVPLIDALSADLLRRFGQDGRGSFAGWDPDDPGSVFLLARDGDEAVGCGAIRPIPEEPGVAEVKRMYAKRGRRGIGSGVLRVLEREARLRGYRAIWLETMATNAEALAFYARHGYRRRDNYGRYTGHEDHVCLEKSLDLL